ncbi:MAG: hypothetical protein WCE72_03065 [Pseudolabrys sp.]
MTLTFARQLDPVAIYAAIVSTVVLIWQIFVWRRVRPRLKVSASANMITASSVDKDTYVVANVRNVGTQRTTITHVVMYAYPNWRDRWHSKPSDTFVIKHGLPAGYPLPHVIEAGRTFMSMIRQNEQVEKLSRERLLFVGVIHSFRTRPILARVASDCCQGGRGKAWGFDVRSVIARKSAKSRIPECGRNSTQ